MGPNWPMIAYPLYDAAVRAGRFLFQKHQAIHRNEGYRPFFIVGSGRSGNTLMRRVLHSDPQIHIPPETYVLGRAIQLYIRNRYLPWKDLVHLIAALFEFHAEFDKFEISLRPLVARMLAAPPESRSLAFLLNGFYRYHAEQTGNPDSRWGDKTPYNTLALPWILRVFPDAQFVHMVRDGADVVHSYVQAQLQPNVRAAAERWRSSIRAVDQFSRRHPTRCFEVKYETLVRDPTAIMEGVCSFLDIEFHQSMLTSLDHVDGMGDLARYSHLENASRPIETDSIGKGRRKLSADERAAIAPLIDQDLVRLGYQPL